MKEINLYIIIANTAINFYSTVNISNIILPEFN